MLQTPGGFDTFLTLSDLPDTGHVNPAALPETDSGVTAGPGDVAVVIVNWNTRDLLRACLNSLTGNRRPRLGAVVVVDNASRDGSAAMVRAEFPSVRLLAESENVGYAAGNNRGIRACTEPYILLLNPDTEVEAGALGTLAEFLDSHPTVGAVAPQLYSPSGEIQRSCRGFPAPLPMLGELLGLSQWWRMCPPLGAYRMMGWDHNTERAVDQPMGSALMVRRQAVEEVGFMDEQFPLFFNEVDWLYRFRQAGWQIWFTPQARVLHHLGSSTRQVRVRAAWLSHTGLHHFYRKHYRRRLHPLLYMLLVMAIYARGIPITMVRAVQQWMKGQGK